MPFVSITFALRDEFCDEYKYANLLVSPIARVVLAARLQKLG